MRKWVLLWIGLASVSQGQPGQSFIRSFVLLAALDTDHDGVLSADEMAAAPGILRTLDRNHDGKLTPDECGLGGPEEAGSPSAEEMVKTLMAFDRNGDGKLQREEIPERMRGLFERGDLNRDGVLTMDEIRKLADAERASRPRDREQEPAFRQRMGVMFMRVMPALSALDTDHDGAISEAEMQNAAAALRTLDRNGDGRLTDDEVTPEPLRTFVAQGMVQFDTDGDGRISTEEMHAPAAAPFIATLMAADRNHDGYVTEDELAQEVKRRADVNHDGVVTQEELQRAVQSGALGKTEEGERKPEEVRKK